MSDDNIRIYYAYRNGDGDKLAKTHLRELEKRGYELSTRFVELSIGNIEILKNDVPYITGMSSLEHYRGNDSSGELDLLYAPLIEYSLETTVGGESDGDHSTEYTDSLESFMNVVITGYEATDARPLAVYGESPLHRYRIGEAAQPPFTAESIAHGEYHHLSWLTIFTPPMVERYGRETLLSAPAWKVEELDDGAILVVCHDDVVNWDADCRAVAEHIGLPSYEDI